MNTELSNLVKNKLQQGLELVLYPSEVLRQKSEIITVPINSYNALTKGDVNLLAHEMMKVMVINNGIGLAANQVGLPIRAIAINTPDMIGVMINPNIVAKDGSQSMTEGCLSFPGKGLEVTRDATIKVSWLDAGGAGHLRIFKGLTATCIQHEIDHLDGILFIDKGSV